MYRIGSSKKVPPAGDFSKRSHEWLDTLHRQTGDCWGSEKCLNHTECLGDCNRATLDRVVVVGTIEGMEYRPPDPNAECICGLDDGDGYRTAIVCPKHDGECIGRTDESRIINMSDFIKAERSPPTAAKVDADAFSKSLGFGE